MSTNSTEDHQTASGLPSRNPGGGSILLPGYGLELGHRPKDHFPVLFHEYEDLCWKATTLTRREFCMLKFVEDITNKSEWWLKVNDVEIVSRWTKEVLEMPWAEFLEHADFNQDMADACFKELRKKAQVYEGTGLIPVMDYSAAAIKSDTLIPERLCEALKAAAAPLEDIPQDKKDWHPGSDGKVLDLVHPSLWPLFYGRSHILPDERINLKNCLEYCGMGSVIPNIPESQVENTRVNYSGQTVDLFSSRFQWLPCDVDLTGERPRISSYINNLHPVRHAALYPVVEEFIEKSLPAWDIVYRWPEEFRVLRLRTVSVGRDCQVPGTCKKYSDYICSPCARPLNEGEEPRQEDEEYEDWYEESERQRLDEDWFLQNHKVFLPDPEKDLDNLMKMNLGDVKKSGFFNGAKQVQIIVKLANIHLTPEKPTYDGGSWHIEGQLNEHICATALYYYDCDNITDCHLDFRTPANSEELEQELGYEQHDHDPIERTFAIHPQSSTLQNIGSVLTREGRMLFFPNVYQHHVSPFELVDKNKPGHRKILALFLVDPQIPVISTANVPPQQRQWWTESVTPTGRLGKLPPEVTDMVVENMEFPISLAEAKDLREELMGERTVSVEGANEALKHMEWSFCEH